MEKSNQLGTEMRPQTKTLFKEGYAQNKLLIWTFRDSGCNIRYKCSSKVVKMLTEIDLGHQK